MKDYKPFGGELIFSGDESRTTFIGKEKDKESLLDDFGVRKYDDGIGRFTSTEPLWEEFYSWTPYQYSANNPVIFLDPSGLNWYDVNGVITWYDQEGDIYESYFEYNEETEQFEEKKKFLYKDLGKELLLFDGSYLTWYRDKGKKKSWKARSGKLDDNGNTDPSKQSNKNAGPIPASDDYIINTSDVENIEQYRGEQSLLNHIKNVLRWSSPGWQASWGYNRVQIYSTTEILFGRNDLYLHGGNAFWGGTWGSLGCIDLMGGDVTFFNDVLFDRNVTLKLFVRYE